MAALIVTHALPTWPAAASASKRLRTHPHRLTSPTTITSTGRVCALAGRGSSSLRYAPQSAGLPAFHEAGVRPPARLPLPASLDRRIAGSPWATFRWTKRPPAPPFDVEGVQRST